MAMSKPLINILVAKQANPYSEKKALEQLRTEHKSNGANIFMPKGSSYEVTSADGVPSEWIQ